MRSLTAILLFVIGHTSFAQYTEEVDEFRPKFEIEDVVIDIDDSVGIDEVIEAENDATKGIENALDVIAENNSEFEYIPGYRIQVYAGSSEGSAQGTRSRLRELYSADELPIELRYELPNFKVKAGDFVDKLTAHRWLIKLKKQFPRALLVPEQRVKLSNVY